MEICEKRRNDLDHQFCSIFDDFSKFSKITLSLACSFFEKSSKMEKKRRKTPYSTCGVHNPLLHAWDDGWHFLKPKIGLLIKRLLRCFTADQKIKKGLAKKTREIK